MLHFMERSPIYYLKHKGWTNVQIAQCTGHHRDTIARVLREEVDKKPQSRQRPSMVAVFDGQINSWLEKGLSVIRMLELAREDPEHPRPARRNRLLRLRAQGASSAPAVPASPGAAL